MKQPEIKEEEIDYSSKEFRELFVNYMSAHSDKKLNMLFWNIVNPKYRLLVFSNLEPKDLVKINNNEFIFRIVKVKNRKDWISISNFINKKILNIDFENQPAAITLKLNNLLAYLNNNKYNVDKQIIKMNDYFSFSYTNDKEKNVVIGNLERDYLFLYKVSELIKEFNINEKELLASENNDIVFKNINLADLKTNIEKYTDENNFFKLDFNLIDEKIKNIYAYLVAETELVNSKFLNSINSLSKSGSYEDISEMYFIIKKYSKDAFKLITMFTCPTLDIITLKPYITYFNYNQKDVKGD